MLDNLYIHNFKCFYESELKLRNLNLFCGTNSSGKSSAIQALLILAHNATENVSAPLNSQWISLGSFNETRNSIKNAKILLCLLQPIKIFLKLFFQSQKMKQLM